MIAVLVEVKILGVLVKILRVTESRVEVGEIH